MDYGEVIDVMVDSLLSAFYTIVEKLPFDKSTFGVIVKVEENNYTVSAFGKEYKIYSKNKFDLGERVVVTAPQNDFKRLYIKSI